MINLRLAEYDLETGKFVRFFNLGLNDPYSFGFYGDTITVYYSWIGESFSYDLDEKDPLNRFNGLFDGRTYSNGRFVLIRSAKAGFYEDSIIDDNMGVSEKIDLRLLMWGKRGGFINIYSEELLSFDEDTAEYLGNLHENPELYEKIYSFRWS